MRIQTIASPVTTAIHMGHRPYITGGAGGAGYPGGYGAAGVDISGSGTLVNSGHVTGGAGGKRALGHPAPPGRTRARRRLF